jgi:adenylate cyclase
VAEATDIAASGLLDGLDGEALGERAELVTWLLDRDFTVEQIASSFSPMMLAAGRVFGNDGVRVSAHQISADTGIELELVQQLLRAFELPRHTDPDAPVVLRADGETISRAMNFLHLGLTPEQVLAVTRVLGHGLAQAAVLMRQVALQAVLRPGATELQTAQALEALVQQITPQLGPMIVDMLRLQLRQQIETEAVNAAERAAGTPPGARQVAVAFADLVGFTRLGETVPPEELEDLSSRLGDLAREVAVASVRFIKSIGDAVMFVSPDATLLLNAVLDLVDAAARSNFPNLRVGLACGLAVSRAGDWFGSPVNLASRVTGVARSGSVLVAGSARDVIGEAPGVVWSFAGARHLKGIKEEVKLFRARRPVG